MPFLNKNISVVIPSYNTLNTIANVIDNIPTFVDEIIVVDDCSTDNSYEFIKSKSVKSIKHLNNKGYGGCQKTCFSEALKSNTDIIAMIHSDNQHNPQELKNILEHMISNDKDLVIGSRFMSLKPPFKNGMPFYKYVGNIILTKLINIFLKTSLSDAHSGYRAFKREILLSVPYNKNSDDYNFDEQILIQAVNFNYLISNVSVSTNYPKDCSSISFISSIKYGLKTILDLFLFKLHNYKILKLNYLKT